MSRVLGTGRCGSIRRWTPLVAASLLAPLLAVVPAVTAPAGASHGGEGDLDLSFGTEGISITSLGGGHERGTDVVVQPDGKIVVAGGATVTGGTAGFGLVRYNSDGTLDSGFGDGGTVVTDVGSSTDQISLGRAVALQSDGKIVVAGQSMGDIAVVRYEADGALDATFGTEGIQHIDVGGGIDEGSDVAVDAGGNILVAGHGQRDIELGGNDPVVVRLDAAGTPDSSFDGDGVKVVAVPGSLEAVARGIALQRDGGIVVTGIVRTEGSETDVLVARLNAADVSEDIGFGEGGVRSIDVAPGQDQGNAVTVQPDGNILVAGVSGDGHTLLVRLTESGADDLSFGTGGVVVTRIGDRSHASDVEVQLDGSIYVAGTASDGTLNRDGAVSRFSGAGVLDPAFGTSGVAAIDVGADDAATGIALQDDGNVVIGGWSGNGDNSTAFLAARLVAAAPPTTGPGSIVFTSTADGGDLDIFTMAEDGTGRTQLTANDVHDSFPDWSPDASKIVFESHRMDPGVAATSPVPAATTGPIGNVDTDTTDTTDEFVEVLEVDLEADQFVACDVVTPTAGDDDDDKAECFRYTYDANDNFSFRGVATTLTAFEGQITVFDDVHGTYNADPDGVSSFNLFDEEAVDDLDIYVMNPDGSGAANLTADHEGYDGVAAWSPDGSTIAFVSDRGGAGRHVWLMNADGSAKRQLTTTALGGSFGRPSWSPDGTRLVIHRDDLQLHELFVTDLPTTPETESAGQENQLTDDEFGKQDAAWSPDGHHIAYVSDPEGTGSRIYVLDLDTGVSTELGGALAPAAVPTFSPDGRYVAYSSSAFGDEEIYLAGAPGTLMKSVALTSSLGSDARPAWADNLSLVALAPTVEASPAVVPVEHIALQHSPDVEAAPLELGKISVAPLELGKISVAPLELGKISVAPSPEVAAALQVPLSTIPPPAVWEEILAGDYSGNEEFQGPLASITLLQVLQNPTTLARFQQRSIAEFDFSRSPLTHLSIYGLLLDGVTLGDINWSTITCDFFVEQGLGPCGEGLWASGSGKTGFDAGLTTLELAGMNTALLRIYAVPMGGITMAPETPLLTRGLAHLRLASGRIGFVRYGDLTAAAQEAVVDCNTLAGTPTPCDADLTLAEAEAGGAIEADATIGHLGAAIDHLTLGEVVTLFAPPDMRHLGEFPLDDLRIAGYHGPGSAFHTQSLAVTYSPSGRSDVVDPVVEVELPEGSPYEPGSGTVTLRHVAPGASNPTSSLTLVEPTINGNLLTFAPGVDVAAGAVLTIRFDIFPGTDVGPRIVPSARVRALGLDQTAHNRGVFSVVPNGHFAGIDLTTAAQIDPEELNVVHISGKQDHKVLTMAAPQPGSTIQVFVDHLTFDVDAALYGTAPPQPVRPYGTSTPAVTPIPDEGAALFQAGAAVAPDALQDFPFLFDLPVTAVGNHRGTTSEHIQAVVPAGSDVSQYVLQLSGYLGDHGPDAFTVRYRVIPPPSIDPAPARTFDDGVSDPSTCGSLPNALATDVRSLIVVPCDRLVDAFGAAAVDSLMTKLADYAAHPKVEGVVLPVDGAQAVQDAYVQWDLAPHEPERANDVVREILTVVDGLVGDQRKGIDYVTLIGDDDILPFARTLDLTTLGNEVGFAGEAQIDGKTNALVGSFANRYLLTDDAYGDWEPEQWGGWPFYLADVAVGRIAVTPEVGVQTLHNFLLHDGELDPQTSYTSGYEFMTDFSSEVDQALRALAGAGTADVNESWSAADALAGIGGAGISSVNAHADPSGMLPANGLPLLTAGDVDALDLTGKLLFSMGCHGGLNRPDVSLTAPGTAEMDFPQAAQRSGAVGYAGNTGYGLGLVDGIGLSEQVFLEFTRNLSSMDLGQSITSSKHEALANEALDNAWMAKALQVSTLYGLPQYAVAGMTPTTAPTSSRAVATDPATGLPAEVVEFDNTFTRETTPEGDTYYTVGGETTRVVGRAVQPRVTEEVRAEGTDAVITDLATRTTIDGDDFDALVVQSAASSSGALPITESPDMISNSEFVSVHRYQTPDGPRGRLALVAGQFTGRDVVDGEVVGTQNLIDTATVAVLNNGPGDGYRPVIIGSAGVVVPTGDGENVASFTIEAHDRDAAGTRQPVDGGLVLAQDPDGVWHRAVLQPSANDPYTLTGGIPGIGGVDPELRFFVQVWDGQLVGRTTLKGLFDRTVVAEAVGDGQVVVTVDGNASRGFYTEPTTVSIVPATDVEWSLDGGDWQPYTGPVTVDGDGVHRFDHRTSTGTGSVYIPIDATAPEIIQIAPNGVVYAQGQIVPTDEVVGCRDAASGIAGCDISLSTIDTSQVGAGRTETITVSATDGAGHTASEVVTYTYSVGLYGFRGFYAPIRNEPTVNEVKAGRTVPVKFELYDAHGTEVTDLASAAVTSVALADCTSGATETNEVTETATDSQNALRYDPSSGQYIYNWATGRRWDGCRRMVLTLEGDGLRHTALFSFKK